MRVAKDYLSFAVWQPAARIEAGQRRGAQRCRRAASRRLGIACISPNGWMSLIAWRRSP